MQELPKLSKLILQAKRHDFIGRLLAIDPGETTGITVIERNLELQGVNLIHQDQIKTWPLEEGALKIVDLFKWSPTQIVVEAYHVYSWRLNEHAFSEVGTIQLIGAIKLCCILRSVPYCMQTAQVGKGFFTDHRLRSLDMYFEGKPHARDSLRHACQFLMFGVKTEK